MHSSNTARIPISNDHVHPVAAIFLTAPLHVLIVAGEAGSSRTQTLRKGYFEREIKAGSKKMTSLSTIQVPQAQRPLPTKDKDFTDAHYRSIATCPRVACRLLFLRRSRD